MLQGNKQQIKWTGEKEMFPTNDTAMAEIGLASEPEAAKALTKPQVHT